MNSGVTVKFPLIVGSTFAIIIVSFCLKSNAPPDSEINFHKSFILL